VNILQEKAGSWGAEIPAGLTATEGRLYTLRDNANPDIFRQLVVEFRQWMKDEGFDNKPLIISEYGVLMPSDYLADDIPSGDQMVIDFMRASFDFLVNAKDPTLGYPADANRLVQQWLWYSLNDQPFDPATGRGSNGALFSHLDPRQITKFGVAFRDCVCVLLATPTPGPTKTSTPTPTATPLHCPEPANNAREGACGPIMPNVTYRSYISSTNDPRDWFYFDMATWHTIEAWLTNIAQGCDYDLYLRDANGNHIITSPNPGNADEHILWGPVAAGRYYLVVVSINHTWSASVPYALRASFGQAALPTSTPTLGPTVWGPHKLYLPVIVKRHCSQGHECWQASDTATRVHSRTRTPVPLATRTPVVPTDSRAPVPLA